MNTNYHIELVTRDNSKSGYQRTEEDIKLAEEAKQLYHAVEIAMKSVVVDGDYKAYCAAIEDYDQFVWHHRTRPNQSNLFANPKIKIATSWTEQAWAPVFERIRQEICKHWNKELVLVQNTSVVESWNNDKPGSKKDVDGGIGWKLDDKTIMPIVVAEAKSGHFDKTICTSVDAIIRRVLVMNPAVLGFCITDDNISVGKDNNVDDVFGAGGILIRQRVSTDNEYPKLDYTKFGLVEIFSINYLKSKQFEDFVITQSTPSSKGKLRAHIDQKGYYIPENLEGFIG
jgi:hypothetical protein